jgi:hypothetical protein
MTKPILSAVAALLVTTAAVSQNTTSGARPRASDLRLKVGILPTGPLDAIIDVAGVEVGHTTIIRGTDVRTGVTAILPHPANLFRKKVPGAVFAGNAFGKLAGSTQVEELGEIETPLGLGRDSCRSSGFFRCLRQECQPQWPRRVIFAYAGESSSWPLSTRLELVSTVRESCNLPARTAHRKN